MPEQYLTQERYEELKKELTELKRKGRQEIAARLKEAKELGDLSENSEYQEARDAQNFLENRIQHVETVLRGASIIKKSQKSDEVRVGSTVEVACDDARKTYVIVGSHESDPAEGRISNESPLGTSLLGKKVGDTFEIKTPKKTMTCKVMKIS